MPDTREKGHKVKPSEHRAKKAIAAIFLALACVLTIFATSASARETHVFKASFGEAGHGAGQLELQAPNFSAEPRVPGSGIALNTESGDIYVADTGNHRVDQFDAEGNFIRAFGADVGGPGDVCTATCVEGTSSSAPGGFEAPVFIAVDNSSSLSKGDVYVGDAANDLVSKFDSAGNLIASWGDGGTCPAAPDGQLSGACATDGPFGTLAGIAVDSTGHLDVYQTAFEGFVFKYAQDGSFVEDFHSPERGTAPGGLAVDGAGNFFKVNGEPTVEKFGSAGADIGSVTENQDNRRAQGLALDPATGDLYVANLGTSIDLYRFNGAGEVVEAGGATCPVVPEKGCKPSDSFGSASAAGGGLQSAAGLAVGANHDVYAADAGAQRIDLFVHAILPDLTTGAATEVQQTTATLEGTVNPDGVALTECVFEYGFEASYGQEAPCEETPAQIGEGTAPVAVHADLSNLAPNRFYHYRLRATNSFGSEFGADRTFTTLPVPPPPFTCPANKVLRAENGSQLLPDCRAYEQVSPDDHSQVFIPERRSTASGFTSPFPMQAAADGNRVAYQSEIPVHDDGGEGTGNATVGISDQILATRGADGWSVKDISPVGSNKNTYYEGFSTDLSRGLLVSGGEEAYPFAPQVETECPVPYSRDTATPGAYTPLFTTESTPCDGGSINPGHPFFVGSSADGSHQLFESAAAKPEAQPGGAKKAPGKGHENIYDSVAGQLYLVNVLPGAKPKADPDATIGSFTEGAMQRGGHDHPAVDTDHAVSADGSRVFWTDLATNTVYVRQNDTAPEAECAVPQPVDKSCTLQVSAGAAVYQAATPDGRYAYYTEAGQLFRFDVETATRLPLTPPSAEVLGVNGLNETGEDGAYLYFVAKGVLTGSGQNYNGETPDAGQPNLYLIHGATRFLATLAPEDNDFFVYGLEGAHLGDWSGNLGFRSVRPTADGAHLAFISIRRLTAYDNEFAPEIYLYDAGSDRVSCASCDPTGAPPPETPAPGARSSETNEGNNLPFYANVNLLHIPQFVSASGNRVFFNSTYSLVPSDTNGLRDVYEWERAGVGSCTAGSPLNGGGCLYLLSGASQGRSSILIDADESGSDVFFVSEASLSAAAHVDQTHLYDVRVDGGFQIPRESICLGREACQGPISPPLGVQLPGTSTFQVNEVPPIVKCKKGQVKKNGKCVTKKSRKHKHHKSKKHHAKRTASHKGGGSK